MFLELLVGYWVLKPIAQDIDRYSYEHELMLDEIEDLREEVRMLKKQSDTIKQE